MFIVGVVNVKDGFCSENSTHGSSECHYKLDGRRFWPQSTHGGSGVGGGYPAPAARCDGAAGNRAAQGRVSRAPGHQHSRPTQHPRLEFLYIIVGNYTLLKM